MSNYKNISLRSAQETGCTTKGSQLTTTEMDKTVVELVQFLKNINNPDSFNAYAAGTAYDKDNPELKYVRSNGADGVAKIWEFINATPTAGQTPATSPTYWSEVTIDDIVAQLISDTGSIVTHTFTAAEIKDCFSSPLTLLPTQGAGKVIVPLWAVAYLDAGAVQFSAAQELRVGINGVYFASFSKTFISAAADYIEFDYDGDQKRLTANSPLLVSMAADMATVSPDYDGTITIKVHYKIISL
jgi:hypothetical protein